ncbi:MAG: dTDP-4-amino-4,6-dideoxygalactose transaminase, partial [Raoultibacter sp.]
EQFGVQKALLTTSGTAALEMAAHLCHLEPGDEVILPSYTFSSTATAFVNVGARLVFIDVRPDTMNMDESKIESAITDRTRVIVPVHYAGVACEMDTIMEIARRHNLLVVEDAAQGVMSTYKGKALGSIGDIGCFSFHATKNYSMGEGGACLLQDPRMNEEAEILREKGTNRSKFFRGQVDKYTWVGFGSSYLPSDLNAAYLLGQLESAQQINENRLAAWSTYFEALEPLASQGLIELPAVPQDCVHNAHLFFVKCRDLAQRTQLIKFLATQGIAAAFHYVPLHSSPAGRQYGQFVGEDCYTTSHSDRLVRLPLYYDLASDDQSAVIEAVCAFFEADMN